LGILFGVKQMWRHLVAYWIIDVNFSLLRMADTDISYVMRSFIILWSSSDVSRIVISKRMRRMGHLAVNAQVRSAYRILVGKKPHRRHHVCYLEVDGKLILKWILKQSVLKKWTPLKWLETQSGGWLLWTCQWKFGPHKYIWSVLTNWKIVGYSRNSVPRNKGNESW
jgi:hypothetical protein